MSPHPAPPTRSRPRCMRGPRFIFPAPVGAGSIPRAEFSATMPSWRSPTNLQAYWRDFYQQATALRKQGVSPEEAAKRIDLTKHAGVIPAAKTPGVDMRGVDRIYDLAANPNAPVR